MRAIRVSPRAERTASVPQRRRLLVSPDIPDLVGNTGEKIERVLSTCVRQITVCVRCLKNRKMIESIFFECIIRIAVAYPVEGQFIGGFRIVSFFIIDGKIVAAAEVFQVKIPGVHF